VVWREGNMRRRDLRVTSCSGGVEEPGMCGHSSHENRETSERNLHGREAAMTEARGKASSRNPGVKSPEESDGNMVPEKLANKGEATPAESMEGKTPAERNSGQEAAYRTQNRENATIGLARVRQRNTGAWLASVIRGFTNYHAVPGNMKAPREFYTQVGRLWLRVIRRRSHKAKCRWTWERFYRLQRRWLPRPRLVHPYPGVRFDAKYSR